MKNTIYIDVDTDRAQPILIGKSPDSEPPKNPEEAKNMLVNDIRCLCETLTLMIRIAEQNNYGDKKILLDASIKHLKIMMDEPKITDDINIAK